MMIKVKITSKPHLKEQKH